MKKKDLIIFKNPPTLETERLILKKITKSSLLDVHEYRSDKEVSRFLLWQPDESREITERYLEYVEELYEKSKFYDLGIYLKENGKMIGTVGFTTINIHKNTASVGYVLNSKYWGLGIAKEALEKIIEFGFETLKLDTLYAKFIEENLRSKRVLEKCGFSFFEKEEKLRLIKGRMERIIIYSLKGPHA